MGGGGFWSCVSSRDRADGERLSYTCYSFLSHSFMQMKRRECDKVLICAR